MWCCGDKELGGLGGDGQDGFKGGDHDDGSVSA